MTRGSGLNRRELLSGALVLAGVTAGRVHGLTFSSKLDATASLASSHSAVFGWNIGNLHGNGADIYFQVVNAITVNTANIDVAFVPTVSGNNFAEVLCRGIISRGGAPNFSPGVQAFFPESQSLDFGKFQIYDPNGLNPIGDGLIAQDLFYSVILKTWVPSGGAASSTARQVRSPLSLSLNANDYLVFHMDHAGVQGPQTMRVCLLYS